MIRRGAEQSFRTDPGTCFSEKGDRDENCHGTRAEPCGVHLSCGEEFWRKSWAGEVKENFLPADFSGYCTGCYRLYRQRKNLCARTVDSSKRLRRRWTKRDVLIFTSPVYVYHVTGQMKALLDHYAWRWMLRRAEPSMFSKQAVCISTAAGGGMKSANKDMADSFFFWGIPAVYRLGFAVRAASARKSAGRSKRISTGRPQLCAAKV